VRLSLPGPPAIKVFLLGGGLMGQGLSLAPGPYARPLATFRGYNLETVFVLSPLALAYFYGRPGLWPLLALGLAGAVFWLAQKLALEPAPWRDLDPWAGALASLALLGPGEPILAAAAGLGGGLIALWPGLIRRPGLLGALLGLAFLGPPPPAWTYLGLLPGALGLRLAGRASKPSFLIFLAFLAAAFWLGQAEAIRFLPFSFVALFLGPDKPKSPRRLALAALLGAWPLVGGLWGFLGGLILWGLEGWLAADQPPKNRPSSNEPNSYQLASNGLTSDQLASNGLTYDQLASNGLTYDQLASNGLTYDQLASHGLTYDQLASNGLTSDQLASHGLTSDQLASNGLTSDQLASNCLTSDQLASNGLTYDQPTDDQLAYGPSPTNDLRPNQLRPNQWTADQPNPDQLASDQPNPDQLASDQPNPDQLASDQPNPDQLASEQPNPDQLASDQPPTDGLKSDEHGPDQRVPDQLSSGRPTPDLPPSGQPPPGGLTSGQPASPGQPTPGQPTSESLSPDRPFMAARLCRREKGQLAVLGLSPEPRSCRLPGAAFACREACLGFGDCALACPTQALALGPGQAPQVDPAACLGCGRCVAACPNGLMALIPRSARVVIPCRGLAKLKVMAEICQAGCLGCGRCAKACPARAISRQKFGPPAINRQKCLLGEGCQWACRAACPRRVPEILAPGPWPVGG
jgi:ferredoxin